MFKSIGIIGYGNFGRFLEQILSKNIPQSTIKVSSRSNPKDSKTFFDFEDVITSDIIIPTVPIRHFESTIKKIAKEGLSKDQLILEVCSIKLHPEKVLKQHFSPNNYLSTHPMFGPNTYEKLGTLKGLNMVVDSKGEDANYYNEVIELFEKLELNIKYMTCDEHDRLAANFHFLTSFIGQVIKSSDLSRTQIDTGSTEAMFDFVEMMSTDIDFLKDLYKFNPYCKVSLQSFDKSYNEVKNTLL